MHTTLGILCVFAACRWGDWRNWRLYYSTILFMIIMDLIYNFLTYRFSMWEFEISFDDRLFPNHTMISFVLDFICFPATILIYLGNYPSKKSRQFLYIAFWIGLYSLIEYISLIGWKGISQEKGTSLHDPKTGITAKPSVEE
ncbi:CBO0543 family protein [Paenibacillus solisilvae]|uniref:CBO0543 family protein n=1 Tax=Paenibacillus solisilvae TaxID=2486751 RepID=A0ABW0VYB0_9BACL